MELYKRYRPKRFKQMVGSPEAVGVLLALEKTGRWPSAILLTGPSGCGKTTAARIIRASVNCSVPDYIEINSADFRGIDTIRDILRLATLAPVSGDKRVFLIDECHKLSNDAQNALLKGLEDTPKHVHFILATTEPAKLIKTIRTRCTEIEFSLLREVEIEKLILRVLKQEKKTIPDEVRNLILRDAGGSARFALVLLDRIIDLPEEEMAEAAEGLAKRESTTIELCRALFNGSWADVRHCLANLNDDEEAVRRAVLGYATSVLMNAKGADKNEMAFRVIEIFSEPFFDPGTKRAMLVACCYGAMNG